MHILLVIEPSGGGSGRHVVDLAQGLIEGGHDVSLIYSPVRAEPRFEAEVAALPLQHLERLPMRRAVGPWDIGALIALRRLIARLGPFDIVHGHSAKAGALARLAAPASSARIYTPHALTTLNPVEVGATPYGLIETLLARLVSEAVIAVSDEEASHAAHRGFPVERLHTIPNGLTAYDSLDRTAARRFMGLPDEAWVVGFVGRLIPQKDPVRFAQALSLAHARDPRILGVMIGQGPLFDEAREIGGHAVHMLGALDARPLMPGFDLFAMTSRYEGFSYAMVEAAAAALPLLTSEVGGVSTLARAGARIDRLPVSASPRAWADAVTAAFQRRTPPSISPALVERFSAARMTADTVAVYHLAHARRWAARG
ncbi:glycosyltransferase family 4 protein [Brevundimonas sp. SL130]|uniref:glycosyltransferase family 4 protein n=1 Tax=Brevundimonas sp. SL130 TaxID=2995143 RepID=UPI00226D39D4|nr:glycosyltransferase family 4 protein [Brevundimonas sp. SL130]WAC59094.1 glycosyltransferase family 4 protein [Brevundimonas sp. SL130]